MSTVHTRDRHHRKTRNADLRLRIVRILRITPKCLSALGVMPSTPLRSHANRANRHRARGPPEYLPLQPLIPAIPSLEKKPCPTRTPRRCL